MKISCVDAITRKELIGWGEEFIPRIGEHITIRHDPIIHVVSDVIYDIGEEFSIIIELDGGSK